jgi:hypothetical protein
MKNLFIYFLCVFVFTLPTLSQKKIFTDKEKIQYLLEQVEKSNGIFIRNGSEHTAKEAREHMQKKLDYAEDKIKTVDQFIDSIATKSYMTGSTYYIKFPDGKQIESAVWLREQLKKVSK